MKLYLTIRNGYGDLDVYVDNEKPIYSTEVIKKAIYLSVGEHMVTINGRVKEEDISSKFLPYYTKISFADLTIVSKKNTVATLVYDVATKSLFIEENEEMGNGTI